MNDTLVAPSVSRCVRSDSFLRADGTVIRNGAGDAVQLCGTNLGGWLVHETWMGPMEKADDHTARAVLARRFGAEAQQELYRLHQDTWIQEHDLDNIAALGMNVVRVPIYYRTMMDENGEWLRNGAGAIDFSRLDWVVAAARARGLYTILDLHGAPGSQNGRDHSGQSGQAAFFKDEANLRLTLAWWKEVAAHFRGNPAVAGYDLLNEPEAASGPLQWDAYDRICKTVREADPEHLIIIEATWNWEHLPPPARYGWTNVLYSNHYYMRENQTFAGQKGLVDWMVSDVRKYQEEKGYPVPQLLGEFCFFDDLESWRYGLTRFRETGYSWVSWTYKVSQHARGNWGLYLGNDPAETCVNPHEDSYDDIAAKWRRCDTRTHFHRNEPLARLMQETLCRDGGLHRPA